MRPIVDQHDLLVFTIFGSEAATEITLHALKQPFHFCSVPTVQYVSGFEKKDHFTENTKI